MHTMREQHVNVHSVNRCPQLIHVFLPHATHTQRTLVTDQLHLDDDIARHVGESHTTDHFDLVFHFDIVECQPFRQNGCSTGEWKKKPVSIRWGWVFVEIKKVLLVYKDIIKIF